MGNVSSHNEFSPIGYTMDIQRDITPKTPQRGIEISSLAKHLQQCLNIGDSSGFTSCLKDFVIADRKILLCYKINCINCIQLACMKNDVQSMKFMLLECAIDPNVRLNALHETPLHVACKLGKVDMCKCMIEHGAYVYLRTKDGQSCLELANGNEGICKILVSNGIDVNCWKNKNGMPVIFDACESGNKNLLLFLINHRVNMNVRNENGFSPILAVANFYLSKKYRNWQNELIDILINVSAIENSEKAKALEIIGCERVKRILSPIRHGPSKSTCLESAKLYWLQALNYRQKCPPEYRLPVSNGIFGDVQTCKTKLDIDSMFTDRSRIVMEAILHIDSIFGISDVRTIQFLKHLPKFFMEKEQANKGIDICEYALKYILYNADSVNEAWLNEFQFFLLYWVRFHELINITDYTLTFHSLLWFLDKLRDCKGQCSESPGKPATLTIYNVATICAILKYIVGWTRVTRRETCLQTIISRLIRYDFSYEHQSLLHYCVHAYFCWSGRDESRRLKCIQLIRCLLRYGMHPDILDHLGDTPLLTCIKGWDSSNPTREELINILLDYAHLDMRTLEGYSALTLLSAEGFSFSAVNYQTLQCLAANVIVKANIPYQQVVPESIAAFINAH